MITFIIIFLTVWIILQILTWTYLQDLQRQIYSLQGEIRRREFEVKCLQDLLDYHGIV